MKLTNDFLQKIDLRFSRFQNTLMKTNLYSNLNSKEKKKDKHRNGCEQLQS